jgi:uncharacterized HAD superfamily protein
VKEISRDPKPGVPVGLITRRSLVQIKPPLPISNFSPATKHKSFPCAFSVMPEEVTSEEPFRVAVDHDNVLVEVTVQFLKFYNEQFKTSYTLDDLKEYRLEKCLHVTPEDVKSLTLEFYHTQYFEDVKPVKGAQEGVARLKKMGCELYDITSRPSSAMLATTKELEKYFGQKAFRTVVFTDDYLRGTEGEGKSSVCGELKMEAIIEDSWQYAKTCAEKGIKALLMDRPWNVHKPAVKGVEHCGDWKDVVEKVKKIKKLSTPSQVSLV